MLGLINLQFLISYSGIAPFLIIIIDKFFFNYFDPNIIEDFSIFYSLIIFVFIGALNWDLKKKLNFKLIMLGFFPSLLSLLIIILFLFSYETLLLISIFFLIQLFFDYFNYRQETEKKVFFMIRVPLTFFIVISLIIIQL